MPSTTKTLYFLSSALVSSISLGMLGYSMSTQWAKMSLVCTGDGGDRLNITATAVITLDLFDGRLVRTYCPSFGGPLNFQGNIWAMS